MRLALGQIDPTVGDLGGNLTRILEAARRAKEAGARLLVVPEMAVTGYPPQDLLHKPTFLEGNEAVLARLAELIPEGLAVLAGCIARNPALDEGRPGKPLVNAAALVERGRPPRVVARKCLLPTYDVFDEARHFEPWARPRENLLTLADGGREVKIGVTICEDIWNDKSFWERRLYALDPVEELVSAGAELIVNLSSSPWQKRKERVRLEMLQACARRHARPIVYVNQVGGNDGLIFDGGSFALSAEGALLTAPVQFDESFAVVDAFASAPAGAPIAIEPAEPSLAHDMDQVERALVLGIRGYFRKLGLTRAVLGISGGIDSSVTAVLAARALGAENVVGIRMPSWYSSDGSKTDAALLAENLGMRSETVAIGPLFDLYRKDLAHLFAGKPEDVTEENIQARIRGQILMAYSNKHGHVVLTTGNKTECSVGFCTIYGDTCGGLAVLADLWKTEVYALARRMNERSGGQGPIPPAVLVKPASPELKPGQVTQDHLPPFDVLDPLLAQLVEEEVGPAEAARRTGVPESLARSINKKLVIAEYKRYQFAPALRVSKKAWVGRSYPIVHRFTD